MTAGSGTVKLYFTPASISEAALGVTIKTN